MGILHLLPFYALNVDGIELDYIKIINHFNLDRVSDRRKVGANIPRVI